MKLEKRQYYFETELNAPIEACFNAFVDQEVMKKWIPDVKDIIYDHSAAEAPYHAGSVRDIVMSNGMVIQERITDYSPPNYCAYNIDSMGAIADKLFSNYHGLVTFDAIGDNKTKFTWQGNFDCNGLQKIMQPLTRWMIRKAIQKMLGNIEAHFS